jgi:RNA polymerase nonessential primary-like sigma factor
MLIPWFQNELSLDELSSKYDGRGLEARLVDAAAEGQEQKIYRKELVTLVRKALVRLNERERQIITNRFGILGGNEDTLEDVAAALNLSRERVRQLEQIAKTKLRRVLSGYSQGPMVAEI